MSALAVVLAAATAVATEIWVAPNGKDGASGAKKAPLATIAKALEKSRNLNTDAPRTIVLADGEYFLDSPVKIGRGDYAVKIKAANRGMAVLTGAMKVTGWEKDPSDERLLVAQLPFRPESETVVMMYDRGEVCELATYPETGRIGYDATEGSGNWNVLRYEAGAFPKEFAIGSMDLSSVLLMLPQEWATTRSYISEIDSDARRIVMKSKSSMELGTFNQGFFLRNLRPGLTRPGTWMYESAKGRVTYYPRKGTTLKNIDCKITKSLCLMDIERAQGTVLDGLVIEGCAARFAPPGVWSGEPLAAAVSVRCARKTMIRNCEIRNTAAAGVMYLKAYEDSIVDSHVHHTGQNGIDFEDGGEGYVKVYGCEVDHVGVFQPSSVGIYCQIVRVDVQKNHIHDNPGNGAVMWSGWSVFASNHIHHCMNVQRDGGGLYGAYNFTLVKGNYCHDMNGWPCLYADEGSQHTVFTQNKCVHWWPTHVHCARFVDVTNNVFVCPGNDLRFSFQGSGGCSFTDNRLFLGRDVNERDYISLEALREWRNDITLVEANGAKTPLGKKRFQCGVRERVMPVSAIRDGFGKPESFWPVQLEKTGSMCGAPGTEAEVTWNDGAVRFAIVNHYNAFGEYLGSRNLGGTRWGHWDGIRVFFGNGFELELYADGKVKANRGGNFESKSEKIFRGIKYSVEIPLRAIGLEGNPEGQKVPFNLSARNEDHHVTTWTFRPQGKKVLTGELVFL